MSQKRLDRSHSCVPTAANPLLNCQLFAKPRTSLLCPGGCRHRPRGRIPTQGRTRPLLSQAPAVQVPCQALPGGRHPRWGQGCSGSTHGCTGQSPLPGGLPAANLIHFLPATSPRCDSSLSSDLRPLPAPTGLCVPSPHRPRPRCRVHGGVPGRVVFHSAVCMGTGRGASGRALRPRAFRVPDVSTPALRRCWRGGGGHKPPTACAGSRAPRSLQQQLCAVAPPAPWAGSRRRTSKAHLSVHSKLGDRGGQAPSAVQEAEG